MPNPLVVLIAAVGGVAIALQSLFSGTIGRHLGVLGAVFLVHLEGLVLAGLLLLLRGGGLAGWRDIPWYALLAGFIGVAIVACVSYAVPQLGLAATLTATITAQLLLGAALDHFGLLGAALRPLDPTRILGIAALLLGSWLVLR